MSSLPYIEPSLSLIASLSGFLLLLNLARIIADRLLYAGLIAEIVLGALLGSPLANIIPFDLENAIQTLGYIGLLLLVAQGGLHTRLDILSQPRTFALAYLTGVIGIVLPIAFSMLLLPLAFGYTYLQSFALGAALSSTSLGTVIAVISAVDAGKVQTETKDEQQQGLINTRLGSMLIGAALLDDIVGLVLSKVVQTLGSISEGNGIAGWTVARPIVASLLFITVTATITVFLIKPLATCAARIDLEHTLHRISPSTCGGIATTLLLCFILAMVTVAHEVDSTALIGAFCAGAVMRYAYKVYTDKLKANMHIKGAKCDPLSAFAAVEPIQHMILAPFFFASIGFAIPLRSLFSAQTVWRGIVYTNLTGIAKMLAGAYLLFVSAERRAPAAGVDSDDNQSLPPAFISVKRWPSAFLLGFSLVSRGEIGFLILNLARESGVIGTDEKGSEAFNVAIWAITLNTLIGPAAVGIMLRNKKITKEIMGGRWGSVKRE